eukprot:11269246-Alexandrium_andersonii.AAC.1
MHARTTSRRGSAPTSTVHCVTARSSHKAWGAARQILREASRGAQGLISCPQAAAGRTPALRT